MSRSKEQIAFRYANFNWFVIGSFFSRTGDWFDRLALNWYIFNLTHSAFYIGLVEFFELIPVLLFSMVGGVMADRWERRKVLIFTQFGVMICTFAIAIVLFTCYSFPLLAALLFLRGFFLSVEIPARNAMIPNLVPKQAMTSAVSLFSTILNTARMIGPMIAGLLLGVWEAPSLILVNAFSFIIVLASLFKIRLDEPLRDQTVQQLTLVQGIKEAVSYLRSQPMVLGVFVIGTVPMIFGFPYTTLLPVFAKELLEVGPSGFGMLLSATAVGSVVSTLLLGTGLVAVHKGRLLFGCVIGFGAGLIFFAFSKWFWLSLVLMFFVGVASMGYRIVERTIIQEMIPDHLRGRILSIVMMDTGLVPLGNVMIGFVAGVFGPVVSLAVMGGICILTATAVLMKNREIVAVS